ncbi:phage antirepressor N-terminal domain-containing protein [Burkholderia ambifaria]|uniref:phage antirepressor N-terminal domain-containing protein n=1 Tax=Burkholderia ambifaria TaxID=152480 RepID=UPI001E655E43|nr:phage antirepressor N-terminal domain-containing protein [Burkholderia ambifaria]UEP49669.1 phage antirepressor N-terminal domain-containing protein [Burkholderia ambifaria]
MANTSTLAEVRQIKVPFHGAELYVVEHNGQPYTPMKPIVGGMGLTWHGQHVKLKANRARWGILDLRMPSSGGSQEMICLPLRKLPGWLMSIESGKVKDTTVRERVIRYQAECDDALWQYWNEGIAVNPRVAFSVKRDDVLTAEQQETLRLMVKTLVDRLPKAQQGPAAIRVWSKLKSHFKVAYRQIPRSEFTEAVSIVTRTAADWKAVEDDALGRPQDTRDLALRALESTRWMLTIQNGHSILVPLENGEHVIRPDQFPSAIQRSAGFSLQVLLEVLAAATGRIVRHEALKTSSDRFAGA